MFALYKKELQSYFYSPFAYVICALFMMVFSLSFINGIGNIKILVLAVACEVYSDKHDFTKTVFSEFDSLISDFGKGS